MKNIPEVLNNFNVYQKGTKLIGVTAEVTLPDFEQMTETITQAGMLGEIESAVIGHFSAMEQEVPFTNLITDVFSLMSPKDGVNLTFRGSQQVINPSTGAKTAQQIRVVEKGTFKKFSAGSLKKGGAGNPTVTFGVNYILIEVGGKPMIELDKLNSIYKIKGKDVMSDITKQC
jgi:hypothetical protein